MCLKEIWIFITAAKKSNFCEFLFLKMLNIAHLIDFCGGYIV